MGRAPCCDKAAVKKGPWSPEEDAMLKNYIEEHGTGGNWIALPHKIGLKRCGKSCRLRWLNYLRPNIKHGDFTPEEDSIICSLYISIGSRWSIIAAQLPGRTDNDVKNYWNTKLKKRLLGRRKDWDAHRQSTTMNEPSSEHAHALTTSALERIQLCMQLQELHNPLSFHHNPLPWPNRATQSNNSSTDVTVPTEQGQSSSLNEHFKGQMESTALESLASPSSAGNSNVIAIEAELQELLYSDGNRVKGGTTEAAGVQQGDVDWWAYDQGKSPVACWDFSPDPSSVFQDYASVYDL